MRKLRLMLRNNRGFIAFLLAFGLFRLAVADYNPIPSGSMHPNILEGDVVLINRLAYQLKLPLTDIVLARLGEPQRGDIATFTSPKDGVRLIKRIVGLPGDLVAMRDKRLYIDGRPVAYAMPEAASENAAPGITLPSLLVQEESGERPYRIQWLPDFANNPDFGPVAVPPEHYLMLGDNRDNSADSRVIGLVARDRLIGRAERILVSADIKGNWLPRFERFGKSFYN